MIKYILKSAARLGACDKIDNVGDWKQLYSLFFSPQGREFCARHNFPTIEAFRKMKPHLKDGINVFVDAGVMTRENEHNIALVGDTVAHLTYNDNTKVHKVILMHGAMASIEASNYAVIHIVNICNCPISIHKDATVRIL